MNHSEKKADNLKFYESPYFINILLLITSITLIILKIIFSIITNSIALRADAIDSLTDIVLYITAIIGLLFSQKKPNEKFPYGYYKLENIVSLIISIFIFITAYSIILQSISEIINYYNGNSKIVYFSPVALIFLIVSLLITIALTIYLKIVSNLNKSPLIKSETNEKFFDIFISLSVIIGFLGAFYGLYILDSIIGLFIAVFIIKGGYDVFMSSVKPLLDAVIDFDQRTELYKLIESNPKIKKIENMEIRSYGKYIFLELEVSLSKRFPLSQIKPLKDNLVNEITQKFPLIFKIIIIVKSLEKRITRIAIPLQNNKGLMSKISNHFGECPFIGLLEFQQKTYSNFKIDRNKFAQEEKMKGILVSEWMILKKTDKLYIKNGLGKGPSLVFNNNLVEVISTDLDDLYDIIINEID